MTGDDDTGAEVDDAPKEIPVDGSAEEVPEPKTEDFGLCQLEGLGSSAELTGLTAEVEELPPEWIVDVLTGREGIKSSIQDSIRS